MIQKAKKIIIEVDESELFQSKRDKKTFRVLSFFLCEEIYCIDINEAVEVVKLGRMTLVPNTPEFILGVTNLHGNIMSVIDIHSFFNLEKINQTEFTRIIVTDIGGPVMGILVDKIEQTLEIDESFVQSPLSTLSSDSVEFTKGQIHMGNKIITYLDFKKILHSEKILQLKKGEE